MIWIITTDYGHFWVLLSLKYTLIYISDGLKLKMNSAFSEEEETICISVALVFARLFLG